MAVHCVSVCGYVRQLTQGGSRRTPGKGGDKGKRGQGGVTQVEVPRPPTVWRLDHSSPCHCGVSSRNQPRSGYTKLGAWSSLSLSVGNGSSAVHPIWPWWLQSKQKVERGQRPLCKTQKHDIDAAYYGTTRDLGKDLWGARVLRRPLTATSDGSLSAVTERPKPRASIRPKNSGRGIFSRFAGCCGQEFGRKWLTFVKCRKGGITVLSGSFHSRPAEVEELLDECDRQNIR